MAFCYHPPLLRYYMKVLFENLGIPSISVGPAICENRHIASHNFAHARATFSFDISSMEVTNKVSNSDCVRGQSFGFNGNEAWVDHGCRADFKVCNQGRATPLGYTDQ